MTLALTTHDDVKMTLMPGVVCSNTESPNYGLERTRYYKEVMFSGSLSFYDTGTYLANAIKQCAYIGKFGFTDITDRRPFEIPLGFDIADILGSDVIIKEFIFRLSSEVRNNIPDDVFRGCSIARHLSILRFPKHPMYASEINQLCEIVTYNLNITELEFGVYHVMYASQFRHLVTHSNIKVLTIHDKIIPSIYSEDRERYTLSVGYITEVLRSVSTTCLVELTYKVERESEYDIRVNLFDLFFLPKSIQKLFFHMPDVTYHFGNHDPQKTIEAIRDNTSLQCLGLDIKSNFKTDDFNTLFLGLTNNTTLRELKFNYDTNDASIEIPTNVCDTVRQSLLTNTTLEYISFSGWRSNTLEWLSDIIMFNESLITLKLPPALRRRGQHFFPTEFFECFAYNKSIRYLLCSAMEEYLSNQEYLYAFLNAFDTNRTLEHITGVSEKSSGRISMIRSPPFYVVQRMLENNAKRQQTLYNLLFPHADTFFSVLDPSNPKKQRVC
jgi:hypothetical protein